MKIDWPHRPEEIFAELKFTCTCMQWGGAVVAVFFGIYALSRIWW